jgi:aminoglycoside phosphotransferase (APT) family kinase protein
MAADDLTAPLQAFLRREAGPGATVADLERLAGGASAAVYSFKLTLDGGPPRELVLRMDAPGGGVKSIERDKEFELLAAAARAGVTVPGVHWKGDVEQGLPAPFFVMDRVAGEAIARRLLRDERYARTRERLAGEIAREMVHTHRIDIDDPRLAFLHGETPEGDDPRRFARAEVRRYLQALDVGGARHPYPLLRLVARWLDAEAPAVERPALVHGDFRIGNVMFDAEGLTAVLDWELCHLGDPVEDLGWLCVRAWRFGADHKPVGGLAGRDELLAAYAAAGGATIDPAHLRYWEIFGNWKWAVICVNQAARHKAGPRPDVELATIGRRVADSEWEILELMGED